MTLRACNRYKAERRCRWPWAGRDATCPQRYASRRIGPPSEADRNDPRDAARQSRTISSSPRSPHRRPLPSTDQHAAAKSP
jgi:hypothetical protein